MKDFNLKPKPRVMFGAGTSKKLGELFKGYGCQRVFIVADPYLNKNGMFNGVYESFKNAGIEYVVEDDFTSDPTDTIVNRISQRAVDEKIDGILGIGGGASMDIAKGVNFLIHSPFPITRYFALREKPNPGVPIILSPTTLGTGAEVSSAAVLIDSATNVKSGLGGIFVDLAVIDPEFSMSMPYKLIGASGLDIMTHAAEALTSKCRNLYSDSLAKQALKMVWNDLPGIMSGQDDSLDKRSSISLAGSLAAMAFSDALTHIGHEIAHAMGGLYHIPHGECCAMVLPAMLLYLSDKMTEEVKGIAECINVDTNSDGWAEKMFDEITAFARSAGMRSAADCGLSSEDMDKVADMAYSTIRVYYAIPDEISAINRNDVRDILGCILDTK